MANVFEVDGALLAALNADAALRAFAIDGIFFGEATAGRKQYVTVSAIDTDDVPEFQDTAWVVCRYQVKALQQSKSVTEISAAAGRIDAVLDAALTLTTFKWMHSERTTRIRYNERDPVDPSLLWQHAGGQYEVWVIPIS